MADFGAPKLVITREPPSIRAIGQVPTTVWHLFGVTEKGPVGTSMLCVGGDDFDAIFGGFLESYHLPVSFWRSMRGKGSKRVWVTRVTHFTDPDDKTTTTAVAASKTLQTSSGAATSGFVLGTIAEPYAMAVDDTIHVVTDADDGTMTLAAARASVENAVAETWDLTDGDTLLVKVNQEATPQTITILASEVGNIDAVTAEELAAIINAKLVGGSAAATSSGTKVTIYSDTYGLDSYIQVTGGTANTVVQFSTSEVQGTGNVGNINAVGIDDLKTGIEAAITGVTVTNEGGYCKITRDAAGSTKTVQVHSDSTGDDEVGLDNAVHAGTDGTALDTLGVTAAYKDYVSPGAYGNGISLVIGAATCGLAGQFDARVVYGGVTVETWRDMKIGSASASDPLYCQTVVNGKSKWIRFEDKFAANPPPYNTPALGTYTLTGGEDGLTSLVDADFLGEAGLEAEANIPDIVMNQDSPGLTVDATVKSIIDYGESRRIFTLFTADNEDDETTLVGDYISGGLIGYSELAATAWPWVKIANPDRSVYGYADTITVPPDGGIMAACFTQDAKRGGVHEAPSGIENGLQGDVVGLATDRADLMAVRDYLYANRINIIHRSKTGLFYMDGTRTLKGDGSFPSIGESRGVLYIEKTLDRDLEWIVNKNITARLYRQIYDQIYLFLLMEMNDDAFATRDPDSAFYINMGAEMNPASEQYAGRINIKIGLNKARPADLVWITITKDVRSVEAEILKAG